MNAIVVRRTPSLTWTRPLFPSMLLDDIEKFVGDTWQSWKPEVNTDHVHPRTDVYEEKDELVVKAELPGIRREDIDISLDKGYLTIKAEKKDDTVPEGATYYSSERWFGTYSRSLWLPWPVEGDKISSTFDNGLLEVRLPKAEEAKPKRIEIKVK